MGIPGLPGLDGFTAVYHGAAGALAAAVALAGWLAEAPIGVLWRALAENERRVSFFGYDTARLKAAAFGVSGALAGAAGVLYAPQQGLVTPEQCGFMLSADLVIWTAVGGRRFVLGPVLGTVLIGVLTAELRDRIGWWEIVVAAIFIAIVRWAPGGLAGLVPMLARWRSRRPEEGIAPSMEPVGERLEVLAPRWPRRARPSADVSAGAHGPAADGEAPVPMPHRDPVTLRLTGVSSSAGGVQILEGLSLTIDRPGIYCLIGPNGAGKTSTFNVLSGELPSRRGEVRLDGARLVRRAPHRVARRGVGRKFQIPSVFTELTVDDNLAIPLWRAHAAVRDLLRPSIRRRDTEWLARLRRRFAFLADGARPAAALSHGERQRLELAMALASEPRLLLLDEPCGGLSSSETEQVVDVVRWARQAMGMTIVIIEHDMALVKALADHVFVLHQGRLLAEGDVPAVRADRRVHEVYVGVAE
jgi:branched-chain amino acid transport system permease protein